MEIEEHPMETSGVKDEAHRLVDNLGKDATWDDLMYEIYVRQAIERGLADSEAGRTIPLEQIRAKYGLQP
jgi:predicted transcriptional regulator